jgi:hypothetical protein
MTKKRKRRSKKRRAASASKPDSGVTPAKRSVAPAGGSVGSRPQYGEEDLIRLMLESAILREEREFADLYLEPRKTLEAAARHFPRFAKRLERAARRGGAEIITAYEDYRIAVLADLDTPELRSELRQRLKKCVVRLRHGREADKLKAALFMAVLLSDEADEITRGKKQLPLGICSLVTIIYEESFDRAMVELPDAREIVYGELYELWCAKHKEEDMAAINAVVERVGSFEELDRRIARDPALALAWERQESYLLAQLQVRIIELGLTFEPSVFTPEEIGLTLERMEQRHLNRPWSLSRYLVSLAMIRLMACARETMDEIVTPARMAEMMEEFRSNGQDCLESENERMRGLVPHVQAAIQHLQSEPIPSRNRVVQILYAMELVGRLANPQGLSPRWRKLTRRMGRSRLFRRMAVGETG